MIRKERGFILAAVLSGTVLMAGCGETSSSDADGTPQATVSGVAMAGPVDGQVTVSDAGGAVIATANVTAGAFTLTAPQAKFAGELDFIVTGSYTDEVSGATVNLTAGYPLGLRAAAGAFSAGADAVAITPETTVIRQMVVNGMALADAETTFQTVFGYLPDAGATPFNLGAAMPVDATDAQKRASFMLGAYSQWGNNLGLSGNELAQLPHAVADDIVDGVLDGADNGTPLSIGSVNLQQLHQASRLTARYVVAMADFVANATANVAHVNAPTTGLPSVANISDVLPATRIITLDSGIEAKVELRVMNAAPLPMMPATAHTTHKVTLTNNSDGTPINVTSHVSIDSIKVALKMHMLSGMSHATAFNPQYNAAASDPANGVYLFDVYYVMATGMSGVPMGVWDFDVIVGEAMALQTARFHPEVKMAMDGNVFFTRGANINDLLDDGVTPRPYWAWLDKVPVNAGGGHDLRLFVSTKTMMGFPAVAPAVVLSAGKTIATVSVEVSTDGGTTWTTLGNDGNGYYSTTALSGLSNSTMNTLQVKLTVDGNPMFGAGGTGLALKFTAP